MPVFSSSRQVDVAPDIAFAVAADVGSYAQFLPLMSRSTVRGARTTTETGEVFDAELAVTYPKLGLAESFVSRVETNRTDRSVSARSSDAPFKAISTLWRIMDNGHGGSEIRITIDYAFRNPLLQLVAGGAMEHAIKAVMNAFEARARSVAHEHARLHSL